MQSELFRFRVVNNLDAFEHESDVIIANCMMTMLSEVAFKVFTRDLFGSDV